jgi:hypothetical protein
MHRPNGILPGRPSLVSRQIFPATPVWPVTCTGLTGTTWRHCKELLCVLVGLEKVPTHTIQEGTLHIHLVQFDPFSHWND